jgi:CheY-like chemotaxis protein
MSEIESFTHTLQRALRNLYDPVELRKNDLIRWIKIDGQEDPAAALRRVVIETIQSMKPDAKVSHESNARRIYQLLTYRFVEQFSQKEVATNLALSIRQLRRLENQAVEMLAERLLARYPLSDISAASNGLPFATSGSDSDQIKEQELEWLRTSIGLETIRVTDLVDASLKTSTPLADKLKVHILRRDSHLPAMVSAQVTTLRQALLNLLTAGFHLASGGEFRLEVVTCGDDVQVHLQATSSEPQDTASQQEIAESIQLARNLLTLSAGRLDISTDSRRWLAIIQLPRVELATVLVIDDNEDALRLMERYLSAGRYRFVGVRDPARVLNVAEEIRPNLILLDVMLPGIDGWELLGRLREHPQLESVPVIVTTILPQESLAVTLGAAGFLRKPFSRERLLQVLDQIFDQPVTKSD